VTAKNFITNFKNKFLRFIISISNFFQKGFAKATSPNVANAKSSVFYKYSSSTTTVPVSVAASSPAVIPANLVGNVDNKLLQARKYAENKLRELENTKKPAVSPTQAVAATITAAAPVGLDYPGVTSKGYANIKEPGRWPPNVEFIPKKAAPKCSVASLTGDDLRGKRYLPPPPCISHLLKTMAFY
jgi:hypothetical protein